MRICFRIHGILHCFYIPILYPWRWLRPGPDPGPEGPHPEPWITSEGKEAAWAKDLQILATVDALAHQLSPDLQRVLRSGFDQALSQVKSQLPEGAEIHTSRY